MTLTYNITIFIFIIHLFIRLIVDNCQTFVTMRNEQRQRSAAQLVQQHLTLAAFVTSV